jgi:hypothetical protein
LCCVLDKHTMSAESDEGDRPDYLPVNWQSYYDNVPRDFPSRSAFQRQRNRRVRAQGPQTPLGPRPDYLPPNWQSKYHNNVKSYPSKRTWQRHMQRQARKPKPLAERGGEARTERTEPSVEICEEAPTEPDAQNSREEQTEPPEQRGGEDVPEQSRREEPTSQRSRVEPPEPPAQSRRNQGTPPNEPTTNQLLAQAFKVIENQGKIIESQSQRSANQVAQAMEVLDNQNERMYNQNRRSLHSLQLAYASTPTTENLDDAQIDEMADEILAGLPDFRATDGLSVPGTPARPPPLAASLQDLAPLVDAYSATPDTEANQEEDVPPSQASSWFRMFSPFK